MIEVRNEQKVLKVNRRRIAKLVEFVLKKEKAARKNVAVLIVNDRTMRRYHRDYMGLDTTTDVMAFAAAARGPRTEARHLGDVVVSAQTARARAGEFGASAPEELGRYVVHGILHLLGYRDKRPADRRRMHKKQEEYLRTFYV